MREGMLLLLALACLSGTSATAEVALERAMPEKPGDPGGAFDRPRMEGDTIENPFYIPSIPFVAAGNNCDFNHDYDEFCPHGGSCSPDVVYAYVCTEEIQVRVDLCGSTYDTKVLIYRNDSHDLYACNDDACNFQALIGEVHPLVFYPGDTYFISIGGYATSSCGDYVLEITEEGVCSVDCPAAAQPEGEPDCYEGYEDVTNGGCGVHPVPAFTVLEPSADPIVICGTGGVFPYGTSYYRDTDWYELNLTHAATICASAEAEFGAYLGFIDGRAGCEGMTGMDPFVLLEPCTPAYDLCRDCEPGTWWLWMGAHPWNPDYECGSAYWLEVTGYTPGASSVPDPEAPQASTWGRLKGLFR